NGTVYFDAGSNEKLWAYSPVNNSTWKVSDSVTWVGQFMAYAVDDTIYFSGHTGGTGREFYAYTITNNTIWLVSDIRSGSQNSNPGSMGSAQDGDVLFFKAATGSQRFWYTYNHSNGTLTELGKYWVSSDGFFEVIDDTLYMRGRESTSDHAEVWAYSAVNATAWRIEDIYSGSQSYGTEAGYYFHTVVNDVLLFDAWNGVNNDPRSIWAYNPANATAWELQSSDSNLGNNHVSSASTNCGQPLVVGDVAYFCATGGSGAGGYELWAYNTTNETTWLVTDIQQPGDSHPGKHMFEILGDTLYFSAADGSTGIELWAYDTSNHTTWRVADINSGNFHSNPGQYMTVVVGDTLYFSAKTEATNQELFAYDTSNQSLWLVEDFVTGSQSSFVGNNMALVAGNKLMFNTRYSGSGTTSYLYGHEPSQINWMTNTGGAVTTWAINNTNLPTGLTFSTSNGTIYGTPTQLWSKTAYTVWANNSGGSSVGYLNITVADANLSYSKYDLTLTKDQASNDLPLNATILVPGTTTSWTISPTLPNGLSFGTSNGTIWGIPTVLQPTATTYTIWANGTQDSVSASITLSIYDHAPGPFEYIPENNTLTNNTYVHLEPDFINMTTGNGSSWSTAQTGYQLTRIHSANEPCLSHTYNGTTYVSYNSKLHGYGIANNTLWLINNTIQEVGCVMITNPFSSYFYKGLSQIYGTSLYFGGKDGSDRKLYGYGMENGTVWVESTVEPGVWSMLVDDIIYFIGQTGNSGNELHAHNLSNGTSWMLDDLNSGSGDTFCYVCEDNWPVLVGTTFVFVAAFHNGTVTTRETWAHDTSNGTFWRLSTMDGDTANAVVIGDVAYFTQTISSDQWLYAYNASNGTFWQVSTGEFARPFEIDGILYGYWGYGYSPYNSRLRAHNPSNGTTWFASTPGLLEALNVGGTLYYSGSVTGTTNVKLWAYEPTNSTGWKVSDITLPMTDLFISLGDLIYFTGSNATISGVWAHSTSNHSTWFVSNPFSSNTATAVAVVNGTLYLGNSGMAAHQPTSINYQTNTGGAVTSWAINASLPSGLSFSTTNGSIYGTPTELWTQTAYMVWSNNSGGSSVAYLNITVVDELPTLSYSPENLTLTKNQTSTDLPLSPTLTGSGAITSWAISPSLPSGLNFGTSNGTIWGTPTVLQTIAVTYTVWANNSGGSSSATVNITVNDEAPDISYSPDWFVLTNNTAMSPTATPTNAGGAIPSGTIAGPFRNWSSYFYERTVTSIAIDSKGYKHISYYDGTNTSLMYATDKTGSWVFVLVDTTGDVGSYASIAIDSNDALHISYYNGTTYDLKYATCSSGCTTASNWYNVSVDITSGMGKHTSIAIDSNDTVHISYWDGSNRDLKYATCSTSCANASNWVNVSVDTVNRVGSYTSIAIGSNDAIHISYWGDSDRSLKYATCTTGCTNASNWDNVTVDGS
ncbi:MAG: putative Ig domain-containing protein, partial [Candidatus Poseidoniaceae archaeon]